MMGCEVRYRGLYFLGDILGMSIWETAYLTNPQLNMKDPRMFMM